MANKPAGKKYRVGPNHVTRHHYVPLSITSGVDRQRLGKSNIKRVPWKFHEAWHGIFGNMTPHEAVLLVVRHLAPKGYFRQVEIQVKWDRFSHHFELGQSQDAPTAGVAYKKSRHHDSYLRLLFGGRDWVDIVAHIVYFWAPNGYFEFVSVEAISKEQTHSFVCDRRRHSG